MKTYEKPKLIALSLSGNNRLCGDCAGKTTLWNNQTLSQSVLWVAGRDENYDNESGITKGDFEGLFGTNDGCDKELDTYCKFTSMQQVAWS